MPYWNMYSLVQSICDNASEIPTNSASARQSSWTCYFLYQDNMSTIFLANKGRSTSERTRHIKIRFFFVTDSGGAPRNLFDWRFLKLLLDNKR